MRNQRRLWVNMALACASLLFSGTLLAADEKAAALAEVNQTRQLLGLPGVTGNALLDQAAQAHADYLQTNINGISHDETPGLSGFTGTTPGARLSTAGYLFSSMNEVISGGVASGKQAVQGLVQAIYHRFGILAPEVAEVGIGLGTALGKFANVVIEFGATFGNIVTMPSDWLGTYPVEGQTGVTRDFYSNTEVPDPVPSLDRVGYPVSIHADSNDILTVTSFTLTLAAGGMPLSAQLLSFPADGHVPPHAAAIVPLAPLDYGTRYQASFSGTRNGQPVNLSWTFTTATFSTLAVDLPYQRVGTNQVAQISVSGGNGGSHMTGSSWRSSNAAMPAPSITEVTPGSGLYEVRVTAAADVTVNFGDQDGQTLSAKVSFADPISETTTLVSGWNLLGNPLQTPVLLLERFGRVDAPVAGITGNVISVWKYLPANAPDQRWAFYTPSMTATDLASFAASKGYAVLERIEPGEGYWVNTSLSGNATLNLPTRTGVPSTTVPATLASGWSLRGVGGEAVTPAAFDKALGTGALSGQSLCFSSGECWQVSGGLAAVPSFKSLWTWDGPAKQWRFYDPNLALQGGNALDAFASVNNFSAYDLAENQYLHTGEGFWVASTGVADALPPSPWLNPVSGSGNAVTLNLQSGWNLLGNGQDQPLTVASQFGNTSNVTTVWKWDAVKAGWQFYAPLMDALTLQTYADGKGYGVLTSINPGEGFWVNVAQPFAVTFPAGVSLSANDFAAGKTYALKLNWNLVGIGNSLSPSAFNLALSNTPPATGPVPVNLTTLWAWDNPLSQWYFYAPNLEGLGGNALFDYTAGKGYLDFTFKNKTLGAGMGFWVNKP